MRASDVINLVPMTMMGIPSETTSGMTLHSVNRSSASELPAGDLMSAILANAASYVPRTSDRFTPVLCMTSPHKTPGMVAGTAAGCQLRS